MSKGTVGGAIPRVLILAMLIFGFAGVAPLPGENKAFAAIQATYYVSPSGSDTNNGTSLSTPFATIQKARDVVRAAKGSMTGDIMVYIRGGNYYQNDTIAFDESDSANNGHTIIYKNYAAETPVFLGGQPITGWTLDSGNVYKANVGIGWKFDALMENNVRSVKARTPNAGSYLQAQGPGANAKSEFFYKSGDLPAGFGTTYAQAVIWSGTEFVQSTVPIASVNATTRSITLQNIVAYNIQAENRYYIQGSKTFLDSPGEYYLDEAAGYLYYYPRALPIASQTIVAPKTKRLLQVRGSSLSSTVSGLQFEGLTFNLSDFTKHYPWDTVSATTNYKEGMVYLENATNVVFKFNKFLNAGYNAVELNNYAQNNTIYGNYIASSGSSGIRLAGYRFGQYGPEGNFPNAAAAYINKFNTVSNNLVEYGGQFVGHAPGISIHYSGDNEISHNNVRHLPYIGISVTGEAYSYMTFGSTVYGQTLTYANYLDFVYARNNQIKFNDVSNVMREAQDGGMIYTWGTGSGNVIDNNILHDTVGGVAGGTDVGIYLDCGSNHVTVKNNIIHHNKNAANTGQSGFYEFLIKGPNHVITNNIAADNLAYKQVAVTNDAPLCDSTHNMTFTNNILYKTAGKHIYSFYASQGGAPGLGMSNVDNNVFFHPSGTYEVNGIPGDDTLANWRTLDNGRYDQNSVIADPLFVNPNGYNYTVTDSSPALAKGFVNIDTSAVGLKGDYPFPYTPTAASAPTPTPPIVVQPVADSYVNAYDGTTSGTNYASDNRLVVSTARRAYLKFDLTGINAASSAKLRVRGFTNVGISSTVSAYGVDSDAWSEAGITANNAPALQVSAQGSAVVTSADQFYEFDVTGFVQSQLAGDRTATIALKNLPGGEYVGFFAKETGAGYIPELVITPSPPTLSFTPIADSYVNAYDGTTSGTNYASDNRLVVSTARRAYLKFDLTGVSAASSAKLRVRGFTNAGISSTVSAYGVDSDAWTETGITADNAPALQVAAQGSAVVTATDRFYEFDVTDFVQSQLAGDHIATIALKNLPGGQYVGFFAKETGAGYIPELVITPPPPTLTYTPVADSYANSYDGTTSATNYAFDNRLVVSTARRAYLKFNLSGVSGAGSAKLRVRGFTNVGISSAVSAYGVDSDAWTETGITANNAPPLQTLAQGSAVVTAADQFYEFDVTRFVQSQLAGDRIVTIALKNLPGGEYVGFFAKETGTGYIPELVLTAPILPTAAAAPIFTNKIVSGAAGTGTAEISAVAGDYTVSPGFSTDYTAYFDQKFSAQPLPLAVVTPGSVTSGNNTTSTAAEHPAKLYAGTNTITNASGYMSIGSPATIGTTVVYGGTSCSIGPTTNLVINGDVVCDGPLTFNGSINGLVIHGKVIASGGITFNSGAGSFTVDEIMSSQGSIAFQGSGLASGIIKGDLIGNGISFTAKTASNLTVSGNLSSTAGFTLNNWNGSSHLLIGKSAYVTGNSLFSAIDKATVLGSFYGIGNINFQSTIAGNGLTVGQNMLSRGIVDVHGVTGTFSIGGFLGALTQMNFSTALTGSLQLGGIATGKVNITNNSSPPNIFITYNPAFN